ncbi:hypothetical protein BG011_000047 [Mortierella polycephala]|uniref:Alpha/beta hydrolase fold-3 domain-containing protein n=1 Tax=Mortierella polycephala TaxID=41804 RepID=A0A9P6QEL0_9FUNG|nr:hypothetical protein BG011_000047 [Mortierella polycephala]
MPPELKDCEFGSISTDPLTVKGKSSRLFPTSDVTQQKQHRLRQQQQSPDHNRRSLSDRLYLAGVLHRPIDLAFLAHAVVSIVWTIVCLVLVDLPFLIWTRFSVNSERHPVSWGAFYSFCMSMSRASSSSVYNVAQLRMVSNTIALFVPLRMMHLSNYVIKTNVQIKVHLDTLLQPERKTLLETRRQLGLSEDLPGQNPSCPSSEFFESFLSDLENKSKIANLPEESGDLDSDGAYDLSGEWIEATEDPQHLSERNGGKKKSDVVILYAHGGGHVFCSAKFHRQLVARMLLEFGPGARAFVVDYRLAPEHPFPAAIHDMYAAYLYLTRPNHEALTLCTNGSGDNHPAAPVNPKNIVLAGDSAGAGLAIAFQLYMRDYVQPSLDIKLPTPPVTVLISAWTDISTSMPAAKSEHSYCYTPAPMGVNPFVDQKVFEAFPKFNFARNYLCGDANLIQNERTCSGKDVEWEWYRHLAQHPLVSPVYTADLSNLGSSVLLQTGAFDRLADDTRLHAYKLGQANPDHRVRLELYRDMVHVHPFFEFLNMAERAIRSMVDFVEEAHQQSSQGGQKKHSVGTEWVVVELDGTEKDGHDDNGCPIATLETCWRTPSLRASGSGSSLSTSQQDPDLVLR